MTVGQRPAVVLHIAEVADLDEARARGDYDRSTRGVGVTEQGFIHASQDADQVRRVHGFVYDDLDPAALRLLVLDRRELTDAGIDTRWEPGDPTDPDGEQFPHLYGGAVPFTLVRVADRDWLASHGLADIIGAEATD